MGGKVVTGGGGGGGGVEGRVDVVWQWAVGCMLFKMFIHLIKNK